MTRRALISVANKRGLSELGRGLDSLGWEVVASGGTAAALRDAGVPAVEVATITGFPEVLEGRVKTLHPAIHAGILARRDQPGDLEELDRHRLGAFDLVAVNLYPFQDVWQAGGDPAAMFENIDIGGVTLIRAAAKNHRHVLVAVDPADYGELLDRIERGAEDEAHYRSHLAARAFGYTAYYDSLVSWYMSPSTGPPIAPSALPVSERVELSYGENPHQQAALYLDPWGTGGAARATVLAGPPLSYNNYQDADAAWSLVCRFGGPAAVAVKHATPCGAAVAEQLATAFALARQADPVSIFGGIVALNRTVDEETVAAMDDLVLDLLIAPDYQERALQLLSTRRRLRVLRAQPLDAGSSWPGSRWQTRSVGGGTLMQLSDQQPGSRSNWTTVTRREPTPQEFDDLDFAWTVVGHVRSNAIVLAASGATTGIGGGQVNRVEACRIAVRGAGDAAPGSVLASDAFIPFPDTVEVAAEAGVSAVIQTGGSVRDDDVIAAADRLGVAMVFTGMRHFKH